MKISAKILALVGIVVILFSGCMTTFSTTNGKLGYGEIDGSQQGQVEVEEGFIYLIHPELATFGEGKTWEELDTVLEPELQAMDANAVRDMDLSYGFTAVDYLLTVFVPFVAWGTYTVEGTAVQQ
jgi:hypothetical protein